LWRPLFLSGWCVAQESPTMRHMKQAILFPLILCFYFPLAACVTPVSERVSRAHAMAAEAGLESRVFEGVLSLQGFYRAGVPGETLYIFIEGDGYAWVSATQPSRNPTPLVPLALQLAATDPAASVLYLARPGQYLQASAPQRYWTSARFAPEVVQAMADAIHTHHRAVAAGPVVLVGYSGGGALAALLAQRFLDNSGIEIAGLITVAGNLDPAYWAESQGLSPLTESLNPASDASALAGLAQRHFYGTRDTQVPQAVLESFLEQMGNRHCVEVLPVDASHAGPWLPAWQQSRSRPLPCTGNR
jgi:pimeloyl-ACP methyl ester carboxylesterase